jgi:hypothetical protein
MLSKVLVVTGEAILFGLYMQLFCRSYTKQSAKYAIVSSVSSVDVYFAKAM